MLIKVAITETISTPSLTSGETNGFTGTIYTYSAGRSSSNLSHPLEYQFDWKGDASDVSPWGSGSQSKKWLNGGVYTIRARARCATDKSVVSDWSVGLLITIFLNETVSIPTTLIGSTDGIIGKNNTYTASGSSSSLGHTLEYQFSWKDDESDLSGWGSPSQSKTWSVAGTYNVRARARCVQDTFIVSEWSSPLAVTIVAETVSTPGTPSGPTTGTTSKSYTYVTGGSTSNTGHSVESQFDWKGDGSDLSAWGLATQSKCHFSG
jgi:hypothetical protein